MNDWFYHHPFPKKKRPSWSLIVTNGLSIHNKQQ